MAFRKLNIHDSRVGLLNSYLLRGGYILEKDNGVWIVRPAQWIRAANERPPVADNIVVNAYIDGKASYAAAEAELIFRIPELRKTGKGGGQ